MSARTRRRRPSDAERGAAAVLVALLLVPMIGFVALAMDISRLDNSRQRLWDTIDSAALAGASLLPDAVAAESAAVAFADTNMPGLVPTIEFRCLVSVTAGGEPDAADIPLSCDPGPPPYTLAAYPGTSCNDALCSMPCDPHPPQNDACNTMLVSAGRSVDFQFAPVIGFDQGNTGTLSTAACHGACGETPVVPADIVLLVDRTGSMRPQDMAALETASEAFLEGLTPALHHVALGTLGRSKNAPSPGCPTEPSSSKTTGPWIPVGLRADYDLTDNDPPDSPPNLNPVSPLVAGIACLPQSSTGTNLADPIAAARAYLLANGRPGVAKGIVFLTDGEANESLVGTPCPQAKTEAQLAEDAGISIVAIAYRLQGVSCGSEPATTTLATMATNPGGGLVTTDDGGDGPGGTPGGCLDAASAALENADGDHLFCSPDAADLLAVFDAASQALLNDLDTHTRLVRIPG